MVHTALAQHAQAPRYTGPNPPAFTSPLCPLNSSKSALTFKTKHFSTV